MKQFRGGLVFKAHRLVFHSTPCWKVKKKEKLRVWEAFLTDKVFMPRVMPCSPLCGVLIRAGMGFLPTRDQDLSRDEVPTYERSGSYERYLWEVKIGSEQHWEAFLADEGFWVEGSGLRG